jgi:hypothetical protein
LSLGARRDYGLSQAQNRLLEPSTIYPTANVRDLVLVEDVLLDAGYTPVLIGTPRKGASNYRLVSQKEADGDGDKQYMRRVWATSQNAQEAHNLSLKYLEGGHAAPTYIRKYTILKSAYAALTAGTPLTAVIGIALTAGGSGYLTAPTVTFSGGSGTGATGPWSRFCSRRRAPATSPRPRSHSAEAAARARRQRHPSKTRPRS